MGSGKVANEGCVGTWFRIEGRVERRGKKKDDPEKSGGKRR
jgi:hypothetical protein